VVALFYSLQSRGCGQTKKKDTNMLKNMTRKSLALGAGLALVASGLTAAPAQAVATGSLWSTYGQTNDLVGVMGTDFTLKFINPAGLTAAAGGAVSGPGVTAQATDLLTNRIKLSIVPKAGQTASVAFDDVVATTIGAIDATNSGAGVVTAAVSSAGTLTGNTPFITQGTVVLGAPTNLTTSVSVDVTIVYDDGSQSETERVTFLPSASVSASITVDPVVEGAATGTGSFSFNGINTQNYLVTNFAAVQDGAQVKAADKLDINVLQNTVVRVASSIAYNSVTDAYGFVYTMTVTDADVITVGLTVNDVEINKFFDATLTAADAAQGKFTISGNAAYLGLDIATASGVAVVQNKNATQATGSAVPAETVIALEGTKSLNFVIQAYTDTGRTTASGANIPVTVTLTDDANGLGTSTITAGGKSLSVSGTTAAFTLTTNSSGQVAFTVVADKAVAGESFTINAVGSQIATGTNVLDTTIVKWAEASFSLLPAVDGNFSIAPGGSLAVDYTVVDQFGNLAGANYQLAMTRVANSAVAANRDKAAEYANWSYVAPVSATGRASATIVDNGLAATEGSDTVTVSLQKAATAGGAFIAEPNSTNDTFVLTYENDLATLTSTAKVNYNGIADAAGTAVAPILIEPDALVNYDNRTIAARPTKFDTNNFKADGSVVAAAATDTLLRVFGTVLTTGNAPVAGVAVKLSAAGLNFADDKAVASMTRASNDSFVVFTDATGSYEAFVRSATAGNVTIAVDAQGATSSVEVRFQNSTGVATGLTLVGPSNVASGARGDFIATVVDKFGKPVSGVAVTFKDNGPGVLNVTAAVTSDAFGEAQATLTTLAAESGTTVVTAYATIGGVLVTQTATVVVGKAAATSSDVVVNVGTFSGKLVVYALNAAGSEVSYKIAGKWVTQVVTSDLLMRYDRVVGANGVTVLVDIYVDGVKKLSKSVVTK
jgi:hypothetical protein